MTDTDKPSADIAEAADRYLTVANGRIAQLTKQRDEAVLCLKEMLDGFERGVFVRSIEGDGSPDWAVKLLPFLTVLGRANALVLKSDVLHRLEAAAADRAEKGVARD